jgi:protein O-GlcNAc transferase
MPSVSSPLLAPAIRHYKAGRLDQAETLLRRLVQKDQAPGEASLMLLKVLIDQEKIEQARYEVERQVRLNPGDIDHRLALAGALGTRNHEESADLLFAQIESLAPDHPGFLTTRGIIDLGRGLPTAAETRFRRALDVSPGDPGAALWLGQSLAVQLRQKEAIEFLRQNLKTYPGRAAVQQVLAFLIHYDSDASPEMVLREQRIAGSLCARSADGLPPRITITPDPDRRITIGIISPDLRQHSCSYFIQSLLERRGESLRIIAYDVSTATDEVTRRLKSKVDQWRTVGRADDADLAAMIAVDKVDIAIDLAGHTSGSRLPALALHPAPICATWLGYPGTTGMTGIDYRIVDEHTDPPGSDHLATETLLRLPGCFLCYSPPANAPDVALPPSASGSPLTFGSFNAIAKLSPATIDLWASVLAAVPGSRLIVKARQLDDPAVVRRLLDLFAGRGIDAGRIEPLSWSPAVRNHLELYSRIDIALDTTPYNGTTTTCEALWMGVPVVTLAGKLHAARVGVSLLHAVGLRDLIAGTSAEYMRIAGELAGDRQRLTALRRSLRPQMAASMLCNGPMYARAFEAALRDVWRCWCASQPAR